MIHIVNNSAEGLKEPWVAYKDGEVYYKKEKLPNIVLYYNDGTKQEYKDEITMNSSLIKDKVSLVAAELNNGITSIGDNAFGNCSKLISVTISNSVTSIGNGAFRNCLKLTSVTIPDSVTSIGLQVFNYCTNLTSISIPNSVTSIGDAAFSDCLSLTSVIIPNSVTSIGKSAFRNCLNLTSITIPESVTFIGSEILRYCNNLEVLEYNAKTEITLQRITLLPIKTIIIGLEVPSIENLFFRYSNLKPINLFVKSRHITELYIPSSVQNIEYDSISSCVNLKDIYCLQQSEPCAVKDGFFSRLPKNGTLHVISGGSTETYPTWMSIQGNLGYCNWVIKDDL